MKRILLATAFVGLVQFISGQNLLINNSFDQGATGWVTQSTSASGGRLELCQIGALAYQTAAAEAGKTYQFHYTAQTAGPNQNVLFGLKFLSSSWNVLGTEYSSFDSPGVFGSNFIQKVAPAGAAWVEVSIAKQNSGCVQVSEVSLTKDSMVQPPNPCSPDVTPPVLSSCPLNQVLATQGNAIQAEWTAPTAADNCAGSVTAIGSATSGQAFAVGATTITYTARDAANNLATCSFSITVIDETANGSCSGNILLNSRFENGLQQWNATNATVSVALGGYNRIIFQSAGGFIQQTVPAKPQYQYQPLFASLIGVIDTLQFGAKFQFLNSASQPIGSYYAQVAVAPIGTAYLVFTLEAKTAASIDLPGGICLIESPTEQSRATLGCPDKRYLAGALEHIGYANNGNALFAAPSTVPNKFTLVTVTEDLTWTEKDTIVPAGNNVIVANNTLTETSPNGAILSVKNIPTNIRDSFFVINGAQLIDGYYYLHGYDKNPSTTVVQNILMKVRPTDMQLIAHKRFTANSYPFNAPQYFAVPLKLYDLGSECVGVETNGGITGVGTYTLPRLSFIVVNTSTLETVYHVSKSEGSVQQLYPGFVKLNWKSYWSSGSSGGCGGAAFQENYSAILKVTVNKAEEITRYRASKYGDCEIYSIEGSATKNQSGIEQQFASNVIARGNPYNPVVLRYQSINGNTEPFMLDHNISTFGLITQRAVVQIGSALYLMHGLSGQTLFIRLNCSGQTIPTTCTNNLLTNPSFATNITGWNGTGATWQNGNLELCQPGQLAYQTVAAEAGKTYQFHYTAQTAGSNQNVLFGLKFLSSSWNVLGTEYSSFDSPGAFGSNFIQKVAPAGTAWVEVSIAKQNSGCVQVSEVCLTKDGGVQPIPCSPDVTPPVLTACPAAITQSNTAPNPTWTAPTATDNCVGSVMVTGSATSGQAFAVGATTVTYTATDAAGNTAKCSFVVTVQAPPTGGSCTNNLLSNLSFATNITGWNGTGATWQNGNLELCQPGQLAYQTVAAEAGKTYQFHYTAQTAGPNQNVLFGLKFLSSSWNVLGTEYSSFDSPGAVGSSSISKVAPVGTAWVEVSIAKQNSGCAQVSEVCLSTETNQPMGQCYTNKIPGFGSTFGLVGDSNGSAIFRNSQTIYRLAADGKLDSISNPVNSTIPPTYEPNVTWQLTRDFGSDYYYRNSGGTRFFSNYSVGYELHVHYRKTTSGDQIIAQKAISTSSQGTSSTNFRYNAPSGLILSLIGEHWDVPGPFSVIVQSNGQDLFDTTIVLDRPDNYSIFMLIDDSIIAIKEDGTVSSIACNISQISNPNPCSPDVTAPVLTACPAAITQSNTAPNPTWTAPTATDNCAGSVTVTGSATSGQAFAVGATTVTYTATDAAGNTATCSFVVTVQAPPTGGSCTDNLLSNPSFATNITGWNGTGGTWQNGNFELCQPGQLAYQTVAAEAGKTYQFHYTAQTAGTNQNVLFGLKFLSLSWNVLGTEYSSFDSPGAFGSNSISKVAPVGTAWVEVSIAKQNSGCVQVSEVCLTKDGGVQPPPPVGTSCTIFEWPNKLEFNGFDKQGNIQLVESQTVSPKLITVNDQGNIISNQAVVSPSEVVSPFVIRQGSIYRINAPGDTSIYSSIPATIGNAFSAILGYIEFANTGFYIVRQGNQTYLTSALLTDSVSLGILAQDVTPSIIDNKFLVLKLTVNASGPVSDVSTQHYQIFNAQLKRVLNASANYTTPTSSLVVQPANRLTIKRDLSSSFLWPGFLETQSGELIITYLMNADSIKEITRIDNQVNHYGSGGSQGSSRTENETSLTISGADFNNSQMALAEFSYVTEVAYNSQSPVPVQSTTDSNPMQFVMSSNTRIPMEKDSLVAVFRKGNLPFALYYRNGKAHLINLDCAAGLRPDVELSYQSSNPAPGQYKEVTLTFKLANHGQSTAKGVKVQFLDKSLPIVHYLPYPLSYVRHVAGAGSTFDSWRGIWQMDSLVVGQDILLEYTGFTISGGEIEFRAQVVAQSNLDKDSSPGNYGGFRYSPPKEDDEILVRLLANTQPLQSSPTQYTPPANPLDLEPSGVIVYPNPTDQKVRLDWLGEKALITLYDAFGRQIERIEAEHFAEFDLSNQLTGAYLLRIEVEGKRPVTRKVMLIR